MKINNRFIINQPLDRIWQVMALEFEAIGQWSSDIQASHINTGIIPDGANVAGRVCTVAGFGQIHEQFSHFDEANKRFGYRAASTTLSRFVSDMENNWSFRTLGEHQTEIISEAVIQFKGGWGLLLAPLLWFRVRGVQARVSEELNHYLEQGEPHPRKRKQRAAALSS